MEIVKKDLVFAKIQYEYAVEPTFVSYIGNSETVCMCDCEIVYIAIYSISS